MEHNEAGICLLSRTLPYSESVLSGKTPAKIFSPASST